MTNVRKVGVVAQNLPPSVSEETFAVVLHSRLKEADFSENINRRRMRPRHTWSAVSACSESRDIIIKFGRSLSRLYIISGTRPRYFCPAARLCIQSREKRENSRRARLKSSCLSFGDFCCVNRHF